MVDGPRMREVHAMNRPFVSILILTYNGLGTIEDCLRSVLLTSYPPESREVIVADNHSGDGTPEFVREYFNQHVRLVEFEENVGFSKGNNRALEHVHCEAMYVVCLNQDTIVHRLWLEGLVNSVEKDEKVAAAYSAMFVPGDPEFEVPDVEGFPATIRYLALTNSYDIRILKSPFSRTPMESGTLGGASFIIRREVIGRIGGLFDEDIFCQAEDDELAFRLRRYGYRVLMVPTSVVFHRDKYRAVPRHKTLAQLRSLIAKAFITTRNRYISFYKNLSRVEFMRVSAVMLLTSWRKVSEFEEDTFARLLYMAGTMVLTPLAFIAFMARMPSLSKPGHPALRLDCLPTFSDPD